MNMFYQARKILGMLALMLILTFTTACESSQTQSSNPLKINQGSEYSQLAQGNSSTEQDFSNWVLKTSKGLIKDAYMRDRNKLGVVISSEVRPTEVKTLAQSLTQGFRHNFPNQDLTVFVYAPDKKLILTARYDSQSKQIEYQQAS